jgi:hypothetical protein
MSFHQKPFLGQGVNWSHSITQGLVGAWVLNEGSGDIVHDLSNHGGDGVISEFYWDDYGLARDALANQQIVLPTTWDVLDGVTALSVATRMKCYSITADRGIFYADNHQTSDPLSFWFDNGSPDTIGLYTNTSLGAAGTFLASSTVVANRWYSVALTWGQGLWRVYLDGIAEGGDFPADNGGTLDASGGAYTWGNEYNGGANIDFQGAMEYGYVWNRELTPQEVVQLHFSPYEMFEQEEPWKYPTAGDFKSLGRGSRRAQVSDFGDGGILRVLGRGSRKAQVTNFGD